MGWSGGTYTRARDFTDDEANGIKMLSVNFDEEHDSIETGLNNCLTKDGQNSPSANLPMSDKRHTGCGNAALRNEYASLGQVQDGFGKSATSSGSVNAYELALTPAPTAYADGMVFFFKAHLSNNDAATMNVDSLGAVTIYKNLAALEANDITVSRTYMIVYFTAAFHLFAQVPAEADPQFKFMVDYFGTNDTWSCPVGVTKAWIECWGAGGGGGANFGGQGGGYSADHRTVTPEDDYNIAIGTGGSAGGGTGGDTIFGANAVVAKGGAGNGNAQVSGGIGDLVVYGNTGLQYTKDMDTSIEGYFGGYAFKGVHAPAMFSSGSNPGGGGSSQREPTQTSYKGGTGMIKVTYVELA